MATTAGGPTLGSEPFFFATNVEVMMTTVTAKALSAASPPLVAATAATAKEMRASKSERKAKAIRETLWPSVRDEDLWDRKKAAGFTTMPRTMPRLINIIDSLTKGQPAGMTYLTLWCRLFQVGIVELPAEGVMAGEAGFTGERAIDTWRKRMRALKELRFIDYGGGTAHDYQWVVVFNPHHVVRRLQGVQPRLLTAWLERAEEVGAKDLQPPPPPAAVSSPKASKAAKRPRIARRKGA